MNGKRIGFFDSGMGGLTVMHMAMQVYPSAHYIYYADIDNVPYGTKRKKRIKQLVIGASQFLVSKKIDILVIACNTATSVCIKELRSTFDLPIIGMEPAVKPAVRLLTQPQQKILVCATKLTLKEKKLKDLISDLSASDRTDLLSLQKLVTFGEKGNFKGKKVQKYLRKKFDNIQWASYSAIVLGCTHFLYYKSLIRKMIPKEVAIIDGNEGTVHRLLHFLPETNTDPIQEKKTKRVTVYFSGRKQKLKEISIYMNFLKKASRNRKNF